MKTQTVLIVVDNIILYSMIFSQNMACDSLMRDIGAENG